MSQLRITSLRVDFRNTEGWFGKDGPCPYLIVNCCFRIDKDEEDFLWQHAKADSEDFRNVVSLDDPERFEAWLVDPNGWDFSSRYDGYKKAWIHNDPQWTYVEKFDTFWFRQWVADCTVTRAIIAELEHYKKHGKLPSVYRTVEGHIILQHLRTLGEYWD